MQLYQLRVIQEYSELFDKLSKLTDFINSDKFKNVEINEQFRLKTQANHMYGYAEVLSERIAAFKE